MSVDLDGESYLPEWDGYAEFLDQSLGEFDIDTANWLATGHMSDISSSEKGAQNSMSSVYGQLASSTSKSSPDMPLEYSPGSPVTAIQKTDGQKPRKKSKGRPKIDPNNSQSATERRRTQVRLAQQAYRHRKEATVASFKNENEDLKDRLANINLAFDQLLGATLKVASGLPPQELDTIHSLCKIVEQYRLPPAATTDHKGNKLARSKDAERNSDIHPSIHQPNTTPMETEVPSSSLRDSSIAYQNEASYSSSRLQYFQGSLTDLFDTVQAIETTRSLKGLPMSPFGQLPSGPIPFSLRFRHEALRRGYSLITAQDTPFSLLCRAFKYCIFSDTREGIIRRVHYLLHQSTKFMYQTFAATDQETTSPSETLHPEYFKKTLQLLESPSQFSLDSTAYYLAPDIGPDTNEAPLNGGEQYIDAEGVDRYLRDRGLNISTGSNFVTIPPSTVLPTTTNPTLFDEIRAGQEIRLSVSKLLYELLDRIVCLDLGPGIRALEIDEAIRSTVIAAV